MSDILIHKYGLSNLNFNSIDLDICNKYIYNVFNKYISIENFNNCINDILKEKYKIILFISVYLISEDYIFYSKYSKKEYYNIIKKIYNLFDYCYFNNYYPEFSYLHMAKIKFISNKECLSLLKNNIDKYDFIPAYYFLAKIYYFNSHYYNSYINYKIFIDYFNYFKNNTNNWLDFYDILLINAKLEYLSLINKINIGKSLSEKNYLITSKFSNKNNYFDNNDKFNKNIIHKYKVD